MGGIASAFGNLSGGILGGIAGGTVSGAGLNNSAIAGNAASNLPVQNNLLSDISTQQGQMGGLYDQQNVLAQQLLAQSQGQGPNPAMGMMHQTQDRANMQNAGLLAGNRGMNSALAARMASQNAMAGNQNIAQQSGILQAQQQLAAQQQLGGLYGQMGHQNLSQQQLLQQALMHQNQLQYQGANAQQQSQLGIAAGNQATRNQLVGGIMSGLGAFGANMMGMGTKGNAITGSQPQTSSGSGGGMAMAGGAADAGDSGGALEMVAAHGARVPGKASVGGDSSKNDTVHAMLSPGEIVVPRSAAGDADSAKEFIDHLMKSEGKKKKKA